MLMTAVVLTKAWKLHKWEVFRNFPELELVPDTIMVLGFGSIFTYF